MAEEPKVGEQAEEGAVESPKPEVSNEVAQPIEGQAEKLLASLGDKLDGLSKEVRGLQGRQDRAENLQNDFQKKLAGYEKLRSSGMSPDEAMAEMDRSSAVEERWSSLSERMDRLASLIEGGNLDARAQQRAKVITEYGLDPKDPEVATIANGNPADFEGAIAKLAFKRQKEPAPTGAQAPAVQGGETKVGTKMRPEEAERLSVETKRLYDHYTKNRAQIEANEARLKEFWAQSEGGAP